MQDAMLHDAAPEEPVSVEIYDQVYTLRGTDPAYIEHLARVVDAKMRAVAEQGNTVDSLRVAVLASLNIADELICLRERFREVAARQTEVVRSRSASLSGMLDEVLDEVEHEPVRRAG
jgi:cell division protein ZapA